MQASYGDPLLSVIGGTFENYDVVYLSKNDRLSAVDDRRFMVIEDLSLVITGSDLSFKTVESSKRAWPSNQFNLY